MRNIRDGRDRSPRGYSLIELLVAFAVLLIILLGLIPLFAQSIRHNKSAEERSDTIRAAEILMERTVQLGFDDPRLTLTSGSEKALVENVPPLTSYERIDGKKNTALENKMNVRYFNVQRLYDDYRANGVAVVDAAQALDASAPASAVHLKVVTAVVSRPLASSLPLPTGRAEVQLLKAN